MGLDDVAADRQAQAGPPQARVVGAGLGREERLEDAPAGPAGAIPTPVSATLSSARRPDGSWPTRTPDRPAARHRLAGVDDQVQEHLLDLRGVDPGVGPAGRPGTRAAPGASAGPCPPAGSPPRPGATRSVGSRRSARGRARPSIPPVIAEARWAASRIFSKARSAIRRGRGCAGRAWRSSGSASARCSARGRPRRPARRGC